MIGAAVHDVMPMEVNRMVVVAHVIHVPESRIVKAHFKRRAVSVDKAVYLTVVVEERKKERGGSVSKTGKFFLMTYRIKNG